jgi:hypothetical protein
MTMDHTVCHFEIPAEEPKRAAEFYRGLFDWDIRGWDSPDNQVEIQMISTVPTDETGRPTRPGVNGMIMNADLHGRKLTPLPKVEPSAFPAESANSAIISGVSFPFITPPGSLLSICT